MKKVKLAALLVITMMFSSSVFSQLGLGLGYSTKNLVDMEFIYKKNNNNFLFGIGFQLADTRGKLVEKVEPNYGKTLDGTGDFLTVIDLGYEREILSKLDVGVMLSIGSEKRYANYLDSRFNGGGYHVIRSSEYPIGVGLMFSYSIADDFFLSLGFNTLKKFHIGGRYFIKSF